MHSHRVLCVFRILSIIVACGSPSTSPIVIAIQIFKCMEMKYQFQHRRAWCDKGQGSLASVFKWYNERLSPITNTSRSPGRWSPDFSKNPNEKLP